MYSLLLFFSPYHWALVFPQSHGGDVCVVVMVCCVCLDWSDKGIEAGASLFKGFERLTMIRAAVIPSKPEMLVSVSHRRTSRNISSSPMIKLNLTGFPANHGETRFECEAIR